MLVSLNKEWINSGVDMIPSSCHYMWSLSRNTCFECRVLYSFGWGILDPLAFCVPHLCLFIECYYGLRGGRRIQVCKYVIYTSDLIKTATIQM